MSHLAYSNLTLDQLTPDLLLHIAQYLDIKSILQLSMTCKRLSTLVNDEHLFRRLVERDYQLTYKAATNTWRSLYKLAPMDICPHLGSLPETFPQDKQHPQRHATCDLCQQPSVTYLSLTSLDKQMCQACVSKLKDNQQLQGTCSVMYNMDGQNLYCFECSRAVGKENSDMNEREKAKQLLDQLQPPTNGLANSPLPKPTTKAAPTDDPQDVQRRKAEHIRYIQELRLEDMAIKHYLVEKNWSRNWMMFRTREGTPPPGPIANYRLAKNNGQLDPELRVPYDKYRPAPETHADIISERLWTFLVDTYGLEGRAYSEDMLVGPDYARLRECVNEYKRSIERYP
ncbi:hypothetical protein DM01DRAFT_1404719 [Hesseltinella vesiculosa]|uniref:DUSP domain-containing protein n=1 Tax=Hesseltinella vesiculosa TaxID=101127 RepID=A0A1X2GSF4_9FUNG|nr:hypothetical protein DM01DRAFT_1404719 [Hesseltinella vesiculosa]